MRKANNLPKLEVPKGVMSMMAPRVVAAKAQASKGMVDLTGPRGQRAQASTAPAPSEGTEVVVATERTTVTLDLRNNMRLGLECDGSDGRTLHVKKIQAGAVDMWNMMHRGDTEIKVNDRVLSVNGISGDSEAMIRMCQGPGKVTLVVEGLRRKKATGGSDEPLRKKFKIAGASEGNLYSFLPAPEPSQETPAPKKTFDAQGPVPDDNKSVIFLDVDGVLRKVEGQTIVNVDGELLPILDCHAKGRALLPEALRALQSIVQRTGARVVVSSEWRRNPQLKEELEAMLRNFGCKIYGETPVLAAREEVYSSGGHMETMMLKWAERRAREISQWLAEHQEVLAWVALDDLDLSKADDHRKKHTKMMAPNLILTDQELALTASDGRRAAELLLKQRKKNGKVDGKVSSAQIQLL